MDIAAGVNGSANHAQTGTARVKRGMAEMLKGGVIMDVVTAEQARIAEAAGAVAVMAAQMDRCTVDGETVIPQPGGFYGGWITSRVVGPFKGGPGSAGW